MHMTTKILPLFLIFAAPLAWAGQSAGKAAYVLPEKYRNAIVKISADNGTPDPPAWYFLCRASHSDEGIVSITVQDGAITEQKPSLNLRVLLGNYSPIDLSRVKVDSRGAWEIATRFAKERGKNLANASYALQQEGTDAIPVWSIWGYDPSMSYIGLVKILSSTGDVIFSD